MKNNFSVMLTQLRKEKGITQREAAEQLGISQSLLSHYEKGIRECNLDFLIKAAGFYNVTTDYLLGISGSKTGIGGDFYSSEYEKSDGKLSVMTGIRALLELREYLSSGNESADYSMAVAVAVYTALVREASAGNIPKTWVVGNDWQYNNRVFLNLLSSSAPIAPMTGRCRETTEPPLCIKTVSEAAHNRVMALIRGNTPV